MTRTDTGDSVGIVPADSIFSDVMLTMNEGCKYHIRNHPVDKMDGWYAQNKHGRNLTVTIADFITPKFDINPLCIAQEDPNQWLLAVISLPFILRYIFPI